MTTSKVTMTIPKEGGFSVNLNLPEELGVVVLAKIRWYHLMCMNLGKEDSNKFHDLSDKVFRKYLAIYF